MFGSKVEYAEGKERIVSIFKQSVHVRSMTFGGLFIQHVDPLVKRLTNCWAASLDYIVMTIR